MHSLTHHVQLEVPCPTCGESYAVSVDVVKESQRLLDEGGPCSGMASHECPAPYLASLASPEAITHLEEALVAFERDARQHGTRAVSVTRFEQENPPRDSPQRPLPATSRAR